MTEAVETIRFPVEGMTCGACVNRIERTVRKLTGVVRVRVDLGAESVTITRDPALVTRTAVADAVTTAGYVARVHEAIPVPHRESHGLISRLLDRSG